MGETSTPARDAAGRLLVERAWNHPQVFQHEDDDSWRLDAACIGMDHLFFVDRGESTRPAKAICKECPVTQECLDYALATGAHHGIWGGLAERERRTYARKRRRDAS